MRESTRGRTNVRCSEFAGESVVPLTGERCFAGLTRLELVCRDSVSRRWPGAQQGSSVARDRGVEVHGNPTEWRKSGWHWWQDGWDDFSISMQHGVGLGNSLDRNPLGCWFLEWESCWKVIAKPNCKVAEGPLILEHTQTSLHAGGWPTTQSREIASPILSCLPPAPPTEKV